MNVFAIDPGLNSAGSVSDERGDFIACFVLPTIGEGAGAIQDERSGLIEVFDLPTIG